MYPTTITDAEEKFGYKIIHIENGYGSIFGGAEKIEVAALKLNDSNYLFKTDDGVYQLMRYGKRETANPQKDCEWFPIGDEPFFEPLPRNTEVIVERSGFTHIIGHKFQG